MLQQQHPLTSHLKQMIGMPDVADAVVKAKGEMEALSKQAATAMHPSQSFSSACHQTLKRIDALVQAGELKSAYASCVAGESAIERQLAPVDTYITKMYDEMERINATVERVSKACRDALETLADDIPDQIYAELEVSLDEETAPLLHAINNLDNALLDARENAYECSLLPHIAFEKEKLATTLGIIPEEGTPAPQRQTLESSIPSFNTTLSTPSSTTQASSRNSSPGR